MPRVCFPPTHIPALVQGQTREKHLLTNSFFCLFFLHLPQSLGEIAFYKEQWFTPPFFRPLNYKYNKIYNLTGFNVDNLLLIKSITVFITWLLFS